MNRVMIDLETLGTQAGCIVATVGAVRFTPEGLRDTLYLRLDIRPQQASGLHLDADTVLWWLKRGEAARAELTRDVCLAPEDALRHLAEWLGREGKVAEVWGNGADFDCVILAALYRHYRLPAPWKYSAHRCYRTVARMAPGVALERVGTHHDALADAISQAEHLLRIWRERPELVTQPLPAREGSA